jgi:hypothetical protein
MGVVRRNAVAFWSKGDTDRSELVLRTAPRVNVILRAMARPLPLDSPRWGELTHAYGNATDVPELLRQLEEFPPSPAYDSEPWFSLWSALAHQGDVYSASFAAVPHVVKVLASDPERADANYFHFPAWVEVCRAKAGAKVPPDLVPAYREALDRLPALVARAFERQQWDDDLLLPALAAIAASKGAVDVAEATLELTPEVRAEFMQWVYER